MRAHAPAAAVERRRRQDAPRSADNRLTWHVTALAGAGGARGKLVTGGIKRQEVPAMVAMVDVPGLENWVSVGPWRDHKDTPCVVLKVNEEGANITESALTIEQTQALMRALGQAVTFHNGPDTREQALAKAQRELQTETADKIHYLAEWIAAHYEGITAEEVTADLWAAVAHITGCDECGENDRVELIDGSWLCASCQDAKIEDEQAVGEI
jgi:hypothetical protein